MGTPVDGEIGARRAKTMASDDQSHSEISVVCRLRDDTWEAAVASGGESDCCT